MVTHDRDLTSRMSWFDRQFLRAQDFTDEQDYQLDRRHRHNRLLHTAGVADGLAVTGDAQETQFTIAPGTALDTAGREIVLLESVTSVVPDSLSSATAAEVYLVYEEEAVAPSQDPGVTGQATRTREAVRVEVRETAPQVAPVPTSQTPGPPGTTGQVPGVMVARLELANGKLAATPSTAGRPSAGALLAEAALPELLFKVAQRPQADWPRLSGEAVRTLGVQAHVHLAEGCDLSLGPKTTDAVLRYDVSTQVLGLVAPNGVSVKSGSSADGLTVSGTARVGSPNPIRFTSAWSGFPDAATNQAEISNDTGTYKTLMIVGNKSADPNARRVSIWDRLEVNGSAVVNGPSTLKGTTTVTGDVSASGALRGAQAIFPHGGTLSATGRLHIAGDELLYVLNKNGVVVGKEWGGNGNLQAQGEITTPARVQAGSLGSGGWDAASGYPPGWGGGLHTWDVYAEGTIGVGPSRVLPDGRREGVVNAGIDNSGRVFGKTKPFIIDHPLDPEDRSLVHAAIEGPEYAVYYRGEDRLEGGKAVVELPAYFEALVREEGRTVQVTPLFEDDEPVRALAASRVRDGRFSVRTVDGSPADHAFCWEVKAVRADVDELVAEASKEEALAVPAPPDRVDT